MNASRLARTSAAALSLALALIGSAQAGDAEEVYSIFKKHCHQCHGIKTEGSNPRFRVLDYSSLIKKNAENEAYVTAKSLEGSNLWQRVGEIGDMPPLEDERVKSRPSDEEIATIKRWIEEGAPAWVVESERTFISEEQTLDKIFSHLSRKVSRESAKHQRYFSLVHLHNNPLVQDEDLRVYRAAFVKLVNSLSRRSAPVDPKLIDAPADDPTNGLIFNLDLRQVDWPIAEWRKLIAAYPYGVEWNDPELSDLQGRIIDALGSRFDNEGLPYIRADWYIATASRPPHYHNLLGVPDTAQKLEQELGVNVQNDFLNDQIQRSGFAGSGVSRSNRLVDRHVGQKTRYYYKSYDFGKSFGKGVLFRSPLGPKFEGNTFNDFAFEHDGGEIIWQLSNGMQGYMLVDAAGKRIDEGPISIVRDLNEHANSPIVTNGVSCFGCHQRGLMDVNDTIRESSKGLTGGDRKKVEQLYLPKEEMDRIVAEDRQSFLIALDRMIGKHLKKGEDASLDIGDFPEPVSYVVQRYGKDLYLPDVAFEMGLQSPARLDIASNAKLLDLGMGPLSVGGGVPRAFWDSVEEAGDSVFQRAIAALRLGSSKRFKAQ